MNNGNNATAGREYRMRTTISKDDSTVRERPMAIPKGAPITKPNARAIRKVKAVSPKAFSSSPVFS